MTTKYERSDVERKLAEDERTGELGIQVHESDGRLHIRGTVATEDRRARVLEVVRECCGDDVVDELDVTGEELATAPERPEVIS